MRSPGTRVSWSVILFISAALALSFGCGSSSTTELKGCTSGAKCPATGTCHVPTGRCVNTCDSFTKCQNPNVEQCVYATNPETTECVLRSEISIDPNKGGEDASNNDSKGTEDGGGKDLVGSEDGGGKDLVGSEDGSLGDKTIGGDGITGDSIKLDFGGGDLTGDGIGDGTSLDGTIIGGDVVKLDFGGGDANEDTGLPPQDVKEDTGIHIPPDTVGEDIIQTPKIACTNYLAHWLVGQSKQHTYTYTGPDLGNTPTVTLEGGPASLTAGVVKNGPGNYTITVGDICDLAHYGAVTFKVNGATVGADLSGDPCLIVCDVPLKPIKDPPPKHECYHEAPLNSEILLPEYHDLSPLKSVIPQTGVTLVETFTYSVLEIGTNADTEYNISGLVSVDVAGKMTIGQPENPGSLGFTARIQSEVTVTIAASGRKITYVRGSVNIGFAVSNPGDPVGDPTTTQLVGYGNVSVGNTPVTYPPQVSTSTGVDFSMEIGPAEWVGPGQPCGEPDEICWCISWSFSFRLSCMGPGQIVISSSKCDPGCGSNQVCLKEGNISICRNFDPVQSDAANNRFHLTHNNTTVTAVLHDGGFNPTSTPGTGTDPFQTNLKNGFKFNKFKLPDGVKWCWAWYKYEYWASTYVNYPCGGTEIGTTAPQHKSTNTFVLTN